MKHPFLAVAVALMAIACGQSAVRAQAPAPAPVFSSSGDAGFDSWRDAFAARALAAGRDRAVTSEVLSGLRPNPRVVELDQRQPEFVSPVWDYVTNRVTRDRISTGQGLRAQLGSLLPDVEARYGVDDSIILGIWGLESNYGAAPLNYGAAEALATLAFEGRRREQFERYLLSLIELIEKGYAQASELRSSWAGALGQPQFMPDVFLTTAVDWDNDGKRDIWNSPGDVAASIAHYLAARGWRTGEPVFDEVGLPENFDFAAADGGSRLVGDWEALGVRKVDGLLWSDAERAMSSQLYLPAGAQGPALLLHSNFAVIRRYNASDRYALVVALLARAYDGQRGLVRPWPRHLGSLGRDQILELQTLLNGLGFDAGEPDGLFGSNTRRAVRALQAEQAMVADGFPTQALLDAARVRSGTAPAPSPARPLDRTGIRELQRLLIRLGFDAGRADGRIGPKTRAAIRAFEGSRGLAQEGRATTHVLDAARAAAG